MNIQQLDINSNDDMSTLAYVGGTAMGVPRRTGIPWRLQRRTQGV
jgi:hypothetical protein